MSSIVHDLAKMIDHSLLHPTMTDTDLREGCALAIQYDTASVCIKPYAVREAAKWLAGSSVLVGTVIGFPHGNSTTEIKVAECKKACEDGAVEIDMVVNIGKVLSWRMGLCAGGNKGNQRRSTGASCHCKSDI